MIPVAISIRLIAWRNSLLNKRGMRLLMTVNKIVTSTTATIDWAHAKPYAPISSTIDSTIASMIFREMHTNEI